MSFDGWCRGSLGNLTFSSLSGKAFLFELAFAGCFKICSWFFDGGRFILPYNSMNTFTPALSLMAFSIYKCLWNTYCQLFEGNDRGHCWHILYVHGVNFWVSSGLPSVLPSFFHPVFSLISFSKFVSFFYFPFCFSILAFSFPLRLSFFFFSSDFIIMANRNLF